MADASTPKAKRGKPAKQVHPVRRWSVRIGRVLGIAVVVTLIGGLIAAGVIYANTKIPDPNKEFQTNTTFVTYADGSPMGNFAIQNRQSIPYEEMPESMKQAVVAAENQTFWTDRGYSITGMMRAAITIAQGGEVQGGSTITQQYIKILYLTSDRTFTRKFKELFLAAKMGNEVPKEEILEGYLNTIYFGRGAYGIQAAAKAYFNVDAKDLTVQQAALLTTVLNNPSAFDPSVEANQERVMDRYRYVLQSMAETGAITMDEANQMATELPELPDIPLNERYRGPKGYLMKMVEDELAAQGIDQATLYGGGLTVTTTIDPTAQDAAVATAEKYDAQVAKNARNADLRDPNLLHPAIASVDNETGELIAMYGGPDYITDSRNWATTPRMSASAYKAFALAAGLRDGYNLYDTFQGNTFTPKGDPVPVRNESGTQYGSAVDLREATAKSINTAFVDMTVDMDNGSEKVAQAAEDAGAPRGAGWDTNTSRISLGMAEVSPLHMAAAYSTFANNGRAITPHIVREVKSPEGETLYSADTTGRQAFDEGVARDVTYALSTVVTEGTGSRVAALDRPVAGKTGTAGVEDDVLTSWFVAYTKQISTAVMFVAGDQGNSDLDPYARSGDGTFYGGTYPAMMWLEFMRVATKDQPVEQFDKPAYVNTNRRATQRPRATSTRSAAPSTARPSTTQPSTQETSQAPETTQPEQTSEAPQQTQPEQTTQAPRETQPEQTTQAPPTQQQTQPQEQPTQQEPRATQGNGQNAGSNNGSGGNSGQSNTGANGGQQVQPRAETTPTP